jgi:hypothetical protein
MESPPSCAEYIGGIQGVNAVARADADVSSLVYEELRPEAKGFIGGAPEG